MVCGLTARGGGQKSRQDNILGEFSEKPVREHNKSDESNI